MSYVVRFGQILLDLCPDFVFKQGCVIFCQIWSDFARFGPDFVFKQVVSYFVRFVSFLVFKQGCVIFCQIWSNICCESFMVALIICVTFWSIAVLSLSHSISTLKKFHGSLNCCAPSRALAIGLWLLRPL